MTVQSIGSKAEFDRLIAGDRTIFVDFYANWCGPCKMISPLFEALARENNAREDVVFCKVNIDDVHEVAEELGISSIPRFFAYKNGKRVDQVVGANRDALQGLVQTNLRV